MHGQPLLVSKMTCYVSCWTLHATGTHSLTDAISPQSIIALWPV